ncbi:MAG: formate/nitrite transporter family protein [bacterium]|nr:formate/nitrite transporter family protein [bacterium]
MAGTGGGLGAAHVIIAKKLAKKGAGGGVKNARMGPAPLGFLAIMGGAFIGLGAMAAITIWTGLDPVPFGLMRMAGGLGFTLGLILVVLGGVELFTGNVLMIMSIASGRMRLRTLMRAWSLVFIGNTVGAVAVAVLVFLAGHHHLDNGEAGRVAVRIAAAKAELPFVQAFFLGVLCNALVCLAVYLCYGAASTTDKILAILLPVATFVAAGFEHSIANIYFFTLALMINDLGTVDTAVSVSGAIDNLVPVILGNIVGGGVLVGLVYWFVYVYSVRK